MLVQVGLSLDRGVKGDPSALPFVESDVLKQAGVITLHLFEQFLETHETWDVTFVFFTCSIELFLLILITEPSSASSVLCSPFLIFCVLQRRLLAIVVHISLLQVHRNPGAVFIRFDFGSMLHYLHLVACIE